MDAIHVVGESECGVSTVERDAYIPLSVSWLPRTGWLPLYLMVRGGRGGDVELKIEPETGALVELVVIGEVPSLASDPRNPSWSGELSQDKVPLVDRSAWELPPGEPPSMKPQVVRAAIANLALFCEGDVAVVQFSTEPVVRTLRCGDAAVGISANGTLAVIEGRFSE